MKGYRAKQNDDGTWDILDVPIMADFEFGRKKLKKVDRSWMTTAIDKCSSRFQEDGYLPPCHIYHHGDPGKPTKRVGHFLLTHASRERFEGRKRWVLFANLTQIPDAIYQRIKDGELPYRSVEVIEPDGSPEIDSLALLEDEAPFFKFGVLTIDEEHPTETSPTRLSENNVPAIAVCRAGSSNRVLFRFQEENMDPTEGGGGATLDDVMKALAAIAEMLQGKGAEDEERLGDESPVDESEMMMDDDKPKDETEEMACDGDGKASGGAKGDMMSAMRSDFAKLSASNMALAERLDARDRKDTVSVRVDKALDDLKGWPLSDKARSSVETFAAQGQAVLDDFVGTYKQDVPKDPPKDFESFQSAQGFEDPAEVAKFAAEGADQLHLARKAYATFRELKTQPGFRLSKENFISLEVERLKREGQEEEVA